MTDYLLPPWLSIAATSFRYLDSVGISRSLFNGATRTASRGGDRLAAAVEFAATGGAANRMERAALIRFLSQLRGRANRAYLFDPAYRIRGSFPINELLSNNTFDNSTTGWSAGGGTALSVRDRVMRVTRGSSASSPRFNRSGISTTAYAPYCMRAFIVEGRSSFTPSVRSFIQDTSGTLVTQTVGPGLASAVLLTPETSVAVAVVDGAAGMAGDYFEVPYISLSRCALVDAGVNLLARSDEFNDAVWGKGASTISANAQTAPDGTATADDLIDNGSSTTHLLTQSLTVPSASADYQISIAVKARNRSWCHLRFVDGITGVEQSFNLSTGVIGSGNTGASWSNRSASVISLGNGWYQLTLIARKSSGPTTIGLEIYAANGDGVIVYSGASNAAIALWRATLSSSGVPARLKQTTITASSGETQNGGALYVKGLPASTSGLVLPGDQVEVIGARGSELKIVTASLDSDASGLGYLQFEPPMRSSPTDNAAVIFQQPMGRFIFVGEAPEWSTGPGIISSASAEFEETT